MKASGVMTSDGHYFVGRDEVAKVTGYSGSKLREWARRYGWEIAGGTICVGCVLDDHRTPVSGWRFEKAWSAIGRRYRAGLRTVATRGAAAIAA